MAHIVVRKICSEYVNMLCTCAAQIKEAILNGVALEDDKRDQFNKIEQVWFHVINMNEETFASLHVLLESSLVRRTLRLVFPCSYDVLVFPQG